MLVQVQEQRSAVDAEIQTHSMVQHRNVIQLISSEVRDNKNETATAFLLFPYYPVSLLTFLHTVWQFVLVGWNTTRSHGDL